MKKNQIICLITVAICAAMGINAGKNSGGRVSTSGSPNEATCVQCHNGTPLNGGGGSLTITSNIPTSGYVAGTTYQININTVQVGASLFGLCAEVLSTSNTNIGSLVATDANFTQKLTGGNGRDCITHKVGATGTDGRVFSFNWIAPASTAAGAARFWVSTNAANSDGGTSGDKIYATSTTFQPSTVGINELDNSLVSSIFPNPAKDILTINLKSIDAAKTIQIIDLLGKKLINQNIDNERTNLNVAQLNQGVYIVQVLDAKGKVMATSRCIKE